MRIGRQVNNAPQHIDTVPVYGMIWYNFIRIGICTSAKVLSTVILILFEYDL